MSFAYKLGFRPPHCNGCEYAQLKHRLGDRFLEHDAPGGEGWVAVYELDREPSPGQGQPLECGGRPVRHRATFMSIGHSDECYHWKPEDTGTLERPRWRWGVDKSKLREMTGEDPETQCYRCKMAPAVLVRELRTPGGGTYLRGWCMPCVDGRPFKQLERIGAAPSPDEGAEMVQRPFKVGAEVSVRFEASVLYYGIGPCKERVFVRRGTQAYEVPVDALCAPFEEEDDDARD